MSRWPFLRTRTCERIDVIMRWNGIAHGERIADHAELERAGWEWQEVDPRDDGAGREERTEARGGK